ncbi:hypothetical protein CPC08DRAFT_818851 [Agrocybe pediades]|nr:hypothetical protein CPC08DRAFT_818851 [Agrocybe pediades]
MKLSILASVMPAISGVLGAAVVGQQTRRQDVCTEGSAVSNPVVLSINPGVSVDVSGQSHSSNLEEVAVSFPGSLEVLFQGLGNDLSMPIVRGPGSGNMSLTIAPQSAGYDLTLMFLFSTNHAASFEMPEAVRCPISVPTGVTEINTIITEDSTADGDIGMVITVLISGE